MKHLIVLLLLTLSTLAEASEAKNKQLVKNYEHTFNFADHSGQTYLSFMKSIIKPAMDELATEGYAVAGAEAVEMTYNTSFKKVQGVVNKSGGIENVKAIAEQLEGKIVTLESLPAEIAKIDSSVDRYSLATFLGLASGGGVVIKYHTNNYAYNVHYDTTEQKSGRSFGAGPTRLANDASDKAYLDDIEEYIATEKENLPEFYYTLMQSLLNSDSSNYVNISKFGQTVLTDFLAVYTAEQARNLMDGKVHSHWDAALLEVTLLASFHAGQEALKIYYYNPANEEVSFTDSVLKQSPCEVPGVEKQARMHDYWQFSRRVDDAKNCRRSGINITNREFRQLSKDITAYMSTHHPEVLERVAASMGLTGKVTNIYQELSKFLINDHTATELGDEAQEITDAWVEFLSIVTEEAAAITAQIEAK
jgi:hypothetical protein